MTPPVIRLIATDLDGTLTGKDDPFSLYPVFSERLDFFFQHYDAEWAVCTGRSLRSFKSVIEPLMAIGIAPRYVIIHHAYIYRLGRRRYSPLLLWNAGIRFHLWSISLHLRGTLNAWKRQVQRMIPGVVSLYHRRNRLCMRFRTDEEAARVATMLREKANPFKQLRVFHFLREVDVRTVPFTKGMALAELASRLDIRSSEILAIGNGHNDISMLDGMAAGCTGCPANAEVDVIERVHQSGGHIAASRHLKGVIEVMDAWRDGTVNSALPASWVPNEQQENPRSVGRRMNHSGLPGIRDARHKAIWLGWLVVYTVLVVFANYGLIPFSGLILKPFTLVTTLVTHLFQMVNL